MKKTNLLSWTLVLTGVLFSFVACSDDENPEISIPTQTVSNMSFTDIDFEEGKIGGNLTWELPANESGITEYAIYKSSTEGEKGTLITKVTAGTKQYTIEKGTEYVEYFHILAGNELGESENKASLAIYDRTSPVVSDVDFLDMDMSYGKIGGILTWKALDPEIASITGYVIYMSDDRERKGEKIEEVGADIESFEIEVGQSYKPYLQIFAKVDDIEVNDFALFYVTDRFETETIGYYILNRGNWDANNATITYVDANGNITEDIYKKANNNNKLGDSAEEILIYGNKMYVTVTGSNRLVVLDLNGKLLKEHFPKTKENENVGPRALAAHDGHIYISYLYGHGVAKLDTLSMEIVDEIAVNRYPEGIAVANGKLYVAISDFPSEGEAKTVDVIDLRRFVKEKEIEVMLNPTVVQADQRGNIFVVSMGNYSNIKNTLQKIDTKTGKVSNLGLATRIDIYKDEIYAMDAPYGATNISYVKYDVVTGNISDNNFIKSGITIPEPNFINIDPSTGSFYIPVSSYSSTNDMYIFNSDGIFVDKMDTQGYYTGRIAFRTVPVTGIK